MLVFRNAAKVFVFFEQVAECRDVPRVKLVHLFRCGIIHLGHVDGLANCWRQ